MLLVLLLSVIGIVPSGGDRLTVELARRWPGDGSLVTVLTTKEGLRYIQDLGAANLRVELITTAGASARMVSLAYLARTLSTPFVVWRLMRRSRFRVAFSSSPFPPDVVGSLVARALGARWVHSWQLAIPPPSVGYRRASRAPWRFVPPREWPAVSRQLLNFLSQSLSLQLAKRWSSKLVVPTQLMADEAIMRGFRENRIHTANYGVNAAEIELAIARSSPDTRDHFDGIFVGRFHPQKGIDDLVTIWKLVQTSIPSARLAVVGNGTGWDVVQFKRRVAEFNNSALLLGVLTGNDKFVAMASSRVFLFPSHHESWGHVVLEAMAVGLPVVGYDIPSSGEAFGDAMIRVPAYDVAAFADAVIRCLNDETMVRTYRRRGLSTAKKYDWDSIAERFVQSVLE